MAEHKQVLVKHDLISFMVDEGIAPLMERLLRLNIQTLNSCEDNVPKGWIWIQFSSAYQAERFLGIVSKYSEDPESLYNRISQTWSKDDESDFWDYSVNPHDYGVETIEDDGCIVETFKGSHYYKLFVSVRFPRKDLEEVIKNLDDYINEFKKEPEEEKEDILNKPLKGTWEQLKKVLK